MAGQRCIDADCHSIAHDRGRKGGAGAEMMRPHQAEIEGIDRIRRPFHILHGANTGGGSIDRSARCNRLFEHRARGSHPLHALGTCRNTGTARADIGQLAKADRLAVEFDPVHVRHHSTFAGRQILRFVRRLLEF